MDTNERQVDHAGPEDDAVSLFNTGSPVNTTPATHVSSRLIVSVFTAIKISIGLGAPLADTFAESQVSYANCVRLLGSSGSD